jgi:hypothetical protein
MVDIPLLQTVSIAIASAGVFLAAVYYILQIRHQTKLRQMDLFMRLYSTLTSKDFTKTGLIVNSLEYKNYDDLVEKCGMPSAEKPVWTALNTFINYFNGVGMLLRRGFIDIDIVKDYYGESIIVIWKKLEPLIREFRKEFNVPTGWEPFEYLYNEMKKREQH